MRPQRNASSRTAVLTVLVAICTIGALSPASASATKSCQSVKDVVPTGVENIPATHIRATGVTCVLARSLPRRVILNARYGDLNPDRYSQEALGIASWRCVLGGFGERTACHSGTKQVSWRLGA
jgi:hypothetical protein